MFLRARNLCLQGRGGEELSEKDGENTLILEERIVLVT